MDMTWVILEADPCTDSRQLLNYSPSRADIHLLHNQYCLLMLLSYLARASYISVSKKCCDEKFLSMCEVWLF